MNFRYAEFFSGGGMVSQALHSDWDCVLANDICAKKNASYKINSPHPDVLCEISISDLAGHDIPKADLFWASFPCQDLSVAGKQQGLRGKRSGLFYEFWRVVRDYTSHNLPPSIVAFENVLGTLRSNAGQDIIEIQNEFERNGYVFGYLTLDAKQFLPQSRPRLFGIGVRKDLIIPTDLIAPGKVKLGSLINWREPKINPRFPVSLEGIVEEYPTSNDWYSTSQVAKLISMMSKINLAKLERAKASKTRQIGFVYKRTRIENGQKIQRAEIRFDGFAGCLRTPAGGSSRQIVMVVDGDNVRARLLSTREAARLMGLPDSYILPNNYNDAYKLAGDGVAVPVVRCLADTFFKPILSANMLRQAAE